MIFYRLSSFLQFLDSHGYFLPHLYFSHNAHKNMRFIWENDIFASQILHKIAVLHEISLSFQFLENDALKKYNDNLPRKEKEFRVFSRENIHTICFLNLEKLCCIISMYVLFCGVYVGNSWKCCSNSNIVNLSLGPTISFFLSQMYVVFFFVYSGNLWSFSLSAMAISDEFGTLSPGFESEILGF